MGAVKFFSGWKSQDSNQWDNKTCERDSEIFTGWKPQDSNQRDNQK